MENLVFLVIRSADICVCCLVSTLDASLSQVSVKKKQNMLPVLKYSQNCHASLTSPLVHGATGCAVLYNRCVATESVFQSAACTCKRHT